MNRFKVINELLREIRSEIGNKASVSFIAGPNESSMMISFHKNQSIEGKPTVRVEFDESDFSDIDMYEQSLCQEIIEESKKIASQIKENSD